MVNVLKKCLCLCLSLLMIGQSVLPVFAQEEIIEEIDEEETTTEEIEVENSIKGSFGDGMSWEFDERHTLYIFGNGPMEDFTINTTVPWNAYLSQIESVWVEDGVTRIGNFAFKGCTNLQSVQITKTVTSIGNRIFYKCPNISEILVDRYNTVYNSNNESNAIIETSSNTLLFGCYNSKILSSITSIADYAFDGCVNLSNITIPASVNSIGSYAFRNCSSLENVTIQGNVSSIEYATFAGCTTLTTISLPESVTCIGDYAFAACSSLTEMNFSNNVTQIGAGAFSECTCIHSITVPRNVENIASNSFSKCDSLSTIYLYKASYADTYFDSSFEKIYLNDTGSCGENLTWQLNPEGTLTIYGAGSMTSFEDDIFPWETLKENIQEVIVEEEVTSISSSAFKDCTNLKTVNLPSSLTTIGTTVFQNCTSLQTITIPNHITSLSWGLFYGCTSLEEVILQNTLKSIGNYAFYNNKALASITISRSVTNIGKDAFKGCSALETITLSQYSFADSYFDSSYTKVYLIEAESLEGYSLSLQGDIGVNFYMHIDETIAQDSNVTMNFTLPNGKLTSQNINDANKISIKDAEYYVFTCRVNAKEMTGEIQAQLCDSKGNVGNVYTYSVEDYANYLIEHSQDFDQKDVDIAKAMLTYGYYSQVYFDYNTSSLPQQINTLEEVDFSEYAYSIENQNEDIHFVGARLLLTSKPGLKLYFLGEINFDDYEVSKEGKYSVVTITDINDMRQMYTLSQEDFTLSYGIFSYANQAMKYDNPNLTHLLQAMYAYQVTLAY